MTTQFLKSPLFDLFKINNLPYQSEMIEHPDSYTVETDLIGFAKDEISVEILGSHLTVLGHKMDKKDDQFRRIYYLKSPVDAEKIFANLNEGHLEIFIPKLSQAQRVEINEIEVPKNDYTQEEYWEDLTLFDPY